MTSLAGGRVVYESDWLASRPFFYNLKNGRYSHDINDVIDVANAEFDPEGLNDFLDFGFSVFERTPLRDVRMLRYSSRLYAGPGGLRVEYLDDPAEAWWERSSTVDEALDAARASVEGAVADDGSDGDVVVPTSGGLDSRLIDALLPDPRRARLFTYGIGDRPECSFESVKARELARRLGMRWQLIPLGEFHRYFDVWDDIFGLSVQAHGMYQIEFYRAVSSLVAPGSLMLSGLGGDWFSDDDDGLRHCQRIDSVEDVYETFCWGGLVADSSQSRLTSQRSGALRLLEEHPRIRDEVRPRALAMVRLRMALLCYLLVVPASFGLRAHAPLAEMDVAMRMLMLPTSSRCRRQWLHDAFARWGLDLESADLELDYHNTLNFRGMRRVPLRPLDIGLLAEVVRPDYVRWVNRWVGSVGLSSEALWRLGWVPGFRRAVEALEPTGLRGRRMQAYGAYLTLKPIESFLRRRERARRGDEEE